MLSNKYQRRVEKYILGGRQKMTLESILLSIKNGDAISVAKNAHSSISIIEDGVFYVQPNYNEIKRNTKSKFIIFSAPGASGKTALAKYVSNKYKGIYWDLSQIALGENSFHGTLWRALNQDGFINYFAQLKEGKSVLVLDAFDEAEMISGRSGVEFFLNDLDEATKEFENPSVLLFARTESASFIADYCEENNISYAQYEIGFFEEHNAKEFIRKKLQADGKVISQTVNECIDQQFNTIKRLLGEVEDSKSFLGYAPVLEALARAYDEERNTIKLLERLKQEDVSSTKIVYSILDYLLEREQNKVCQAVKEKWSAKYPEFIEWDKVYSKKEQIVRIAEYILLGNVEESSFYDELIMPDELYVEYYDSIKRFLPQHPFLQNLIEDGHSDFTGPAFRDYVLAALLSEDKYIDLATEYFGVNNKNVHVSSQLLIDFYYYISNGKVQGDIFFILYDSYKAKETAEKHALVDIIQSGAETYLKFALKAIGKDLSIDEMEFELCKDIINVSKLSNAFIDAEKKVVIGDSKNNARISNSTILAGEIVFNSGCIEIEAKAPGCCLLFSQNDVINQRGETPRFEIRSEQDDLVKIDFPNIDSYFKLRKYKYTYEQSDSNDYLKFNLFVKKIMNCMRKHRKDAPAKDREFIDNEIINKSAFKRSAMTFLNDIGIIYVDSKETHLYKLNVEALTKHGLNWMDFGCGVGDELQNLYQEFLAWNNKNS